MNVAFLIIVLGSCLLFGYADDAHADIIEEVPQVDIHILSILKKEVAATVNGGYFSPKVIEELLGAKDSSESFNSKVDEIITAVKHEILIGLWDPADINGYDIAFEYRPLLVTYSGTLSLSIGRIQDLSTLSRNGDAILTWTYPGNTTRLTIPLAFRNIIVSYNFLMQVRGDTVKGVLYAWVADITANYSATIDVDTQTIISGNVSLNIGSLDIDLQSASISSAYRRLITELTTDLMVEVVSEQVDKIVGSLLNSSVFGIVENM